MGRSRSDELVPTRKVDYLTEDAAIVGQAYVCVSFISPTDILPRKDAFCFDMFVKEIFRPKIEAFVAAVNESPASIGQFSDSILSDIRDVHSDVSTFVAHNQARLDDLFAAENPLQLTTSGFKVRGSFPDVESAKKRAEFLQQQDATVDVFVAQVGAWCPFNPAAEEIGDIVYDETELNTLMKKKREAEQAKAATFAQSTEIRVEATRRDAQQGQGRAESVHDDDDAAPHDDETLASTSHADSV